MPWAEKGERVVVELTGVGKQGFEDPVQNSEHGMGGGVTTCNLEWSVLKRSRKTRSP